MQLNFRANIWGLKALGVETILCASAVGSMKLEYAPTDIVFFAEVQLVAVIGDDFESEHLEVFQDRRIDLSGLERAKGGKTNAATASSASSPSSRISTRTTIR